MLVADVRRTKALGELLESATVTDASGDPVDLNALSGNSLADLAAGAAGEDDDFVDESDEDEDVTP
jgi:trigger factor